MSKLTKWIALVSYRLRLKVRNFCGGARSWHKERSQWNGGPIYCWPFLERTKRSGWLKGRLWCVLIESMKYMAYAMGDMMKSGTHAHGLCSAPLFSPCHKALAPEKFEDWTGNEEDSGELGFESKERESMNLPPVVEGCISAMHQNGDGRNYRQTTFAGACSS